MEDAMVGMHVDAAANRIRGIINVSNGSDKNMS